MYWQKSSSPTIWSPLALSISDRSDLEANVLCVCVYISLACLDVLDLVEKKVQDELLGELRVGGVPNRLGAADFPVAYHTHTTTAPVNKTKGSVSQISTKAGVFMCLCPHECRRKSED